MTRLSVPAVLSVWESIPDAPPVHVVDSVPVEAGPGDTVLYSLLTPQLPEIHPEILSLRDRGLTLIAGGPHAAGDPEFTRKNGFHSLVGGDCETALPDLIRDLASGPEQLQPVYDGGREADLSARLPLSDAVPTLPPLEIMRGCRHGCTYCAVPLSGPPRYRSLASVREYLECLRFRGSNRVNFVSPSALEYRDPASAPDPRKAVTQVLTAARRAGFRYIEYGIFPSEIRPDCLDAEWVRLLKEFVSHRRLTLGIQSGRPSRLQSLHRGHSLESVEAAVAAANAGGFAVNLDVMVGLPGETPDELRQGTALIRRLHKRLRVRAQVHHFFPLPGTPLAERLPAFPGPQEIRLLDQLARDGLITSQWRTGREDARRYLHWLRRYFPEVHARFH